MRFIAVQGLDRYPIRQQRKHYAYFLPRIEIFQPLRADNIVSKLIFRWRYQCSRYRVRINRFHRGNIRTMTLFQVNFHSIRFDYGLICARPDNTKKEEEQKNCDTKINLLWPTRLFLWSHNHLIAFFFFLFTTRLVITVIIITKPFDSRLIKKT